MRYFINANQPKIFFLDPRQMLSSQKHRCTRLEPQQQRKTLQHGGRSKASPDETLLQQKLRLIIIGSFVYKLIRTKAFRWLQHPNRSGASILVKVYMVTTANDLFWLKYNGLAKRANSHLKRGQRSF